MIECDCCKFEFSSNELYDLEYNGDKLCSDCYDFAIRALYTKKFLSSNIKRTKEE